MDIFPLPNFSMSVFLQMMYIDSLELDEFISDCMPRVDAWDSTLIKRVVKKDRISPGVFGNLQVCRQDLYSLFFLKISINLFILTFVFMPFPSKYSLKRSLGIHSKV